jgi:predicted CoA-binding protein
MNHDHYDDTYIRDILLAHKSFAMVGASPNIVRPSYFALKYLVQKGFRVIPVNPTHAGKTLLGETIIASLKDLEGPVDIVDVFRNAKEAVPITRDAIDIGAKVVWMQIGVRNDEAAEIAEAAGLKVVMNRCPKIEYGRLSGEIGWAGVNTRTISNKRPRLAKGYQHRVISGGRARPQSIIED